MEDSVDNEAVFRNVKERTFNPSDLILFWFIANIPAIPVQVLCDDEREKAQKSSKKWAFRKQHPILAI